MAREPRTSAERQRAFEAYCGSVHRFDYLSCVQHRRGVPSRSKIEELTRTWFEMGVPLIVELQVSHARIPAGADDRPS